LAGFQFFTEEFSMSQAFSFLLASVALFGGQASSRQVPALEAGGAIIDLTAPKTVSPRRMSSAGAINVRVLDVRGGHLIVLSIGADKGVRKGQGGGLSTGWPDRPNSMPASEMVEIIEVAAKHSIGRVRSPGFLHWALQNKDNPVRKNELIWHPWSEEHTQLMLRFLDDPSSRDQLIRDLERRLERGGAIIEADGN